jgi:O-antigen/teichoic acid export membrane protein
MNKESLKKTAIKGSAWEVSAAIVQRVGGLLFTIILARFLLPEGFGLYSLALSVSMIFFVFAQAGIDSSLIRYVSDAIKQKDATKERSTFRYLLKIKIAALFVVSSLFVLSAYPLANYFFEKPSLFVPLLLAGAYNFVFSAERFFTSFFYARKKVNYRTYKEIIFQVARIGIISLLFFSAYFSPDVFATLISLILASFITLIFVVYKTNSLSPKIFFMPEQQLAREEKKRINHFIVYITLNFLVILVLGQIDTITLGWLVKDSFYIGLYNSAFVLVASISGLISFSGVLLPLLMQVKKRDLERVFNEAFRYLMILTIPMALGLIALGNYLIVFFYGHEYLEAVAPLCILSIFAVFSVHVSLSSEMFSVKEKPQEYFKLTIFIAVLNIALNYLFIKCFLLYSPSFAMLGAAIGTTLSWVSYSLGMGFLIRKRFNIRTKVYAVFKPFISATIMLFIVLLLKARMGDINLFNGGFLLLFGILSYFLVLFLLKGIRREDFSILEAFSSLIKRGSN